MMRFYSGQHRFCCGVDRHTRTLSLCMLDSAGAIVFEATLPPEPDRLLAALAPYRDGLVVGCECLFAWYWLADWCAAQAIPFVLGHALYLKPIHGGKTDTIDAQKLPACSAAAPSPRSTSTPSRCGPPVTCSAAAPTSSASGPSCSPTCR
jgi:hypothetical protein